VCRNLSCLLRGGGAVKAAIETRLGIRHGECTADGRFSLEEVECLASCGTAPVVQVNNQEYHEGLDVERALALVERLARE
jgi:NADH-quinone oxidoreductase subunit E